MKSKIINIFAQLLEIDPSSVREDMRFEEIPEWDSMRFVMVLSELEEAGIRVPLEDAMQMQTVSELLRFAGTVEEDS